MRILLTNDDGIDAPGLQALWESIHHAFESEIVEVAVVAPDRGRSECGHSVTSGRPLSVKETRPGWFSVDGTPVDCVRVALGVVVNEPTMVISGINAGANLGVDLLCSGTFAAAREAALHQIPAMAVSHYRRPDVQRSWEHTPRWLKATLLAFHARVSENSCSGVLWNVNLPAIDPLSEPPPQLWCPVDRKPIARQANQKDSTVSFESDFHSRPRERGSDVDHCFAGSITISELNPLG